MNSAQLVGRIGKDLELRQTQSGKSVCSFSLAVSDYKETTWIDIVAWGKTAETICQYMQKGSMIGIVGRIQTRKYTDKQGNNRTATEVVADRMHFVESKNSGGKPTDTFEEVDNDGDLPWD